MDLRNQNFGIEIEMTGISRYRAATVIAEYFGTASRPEGTYYDAYSAPDGEGRRWKVMSDGSIDCQTKQGGQRVSADGKYSVELVSPICRYGDIGTVQELVRKLREAGAFVNPSCGIHIHIKAAPFDASKLRNLVNIMAAKEDMVYKALRVDQTREFDYCQKINQRFLERLNRVKPADVPGEYRELILETRESFKLLDQCIATVNGMVEEGNGLDAVRVKAMFFSLYFGGEQPSQEDIARFVDCFVTYEERTREVENEDGTTGMETYTLAVLIEDLSTVWANIASAMGMEITAEARANAESVYNLIQYGWSQGGDWSGELGEPAVSADGFCSPLGAGWQSRVTSEYGWRICPYHGRELHSGLDMAVPSGTPIRAALGGSVIKSVYNGSYGNYTMIDHGNGLTTAYVHQSQRLVSVGDVVEAGQVIGLVGSTGNSTGTHLHLEVRVNGQLQNPRSYLP